MKAGYELKMMKRGRREDGSGQNKKKHRFKKDDITERWLSQRHVCSSVQQQRERGGEREGDSLQDIWRSEGSQPHTTL